MPVNVEVASTVHHPPKEEDDAREEKQRAQCDPQPCFFNKSLHGHGVALGVFLCNWGYPVEAAQSTPQA